MGQINWQSGRIKKQNEMESYKSMLRDRAEKDALIQKQLDERGRLQNKLDDLTSKQQKEVNLLKEAVFAKLPEEKITTLQKEFDQSLQNPEYRNELNM